MYLFLHHGSKTLQGIILPILEGENQDAKNPAKEKKPTQLELTTQQNSTPP